MFFCFVITSDLLLDFVTQYDFSHICSKLCSNVNSKTISKYKNDNHEKINPKYSCHYGSFHVEYVEEISYHDLRS